jgi:hypothetical protein
MINNLARQFLYKTLGNKKYLSLVSNIFLRMYHAGYEKKLSGNVFNDLNGLKNIEDNLNKSCDLYLLQPETIASLQSIIKNNPCRRQS